MKKIIVLDTSAFIAGVEPQTFEECWTTNKVIEELRKSINENIKLRVEIGISSGKLKIVDADDIKIDTNDDLSDADLSVVSLAYKYKDKAIVVTNDYGIQNACKRLGIRYISAGEIGIRKILKWFYVCSGCGKKFDRKVDICDVCGSKIKRKAKAVKGVENA